MTKKDRARLARLSAELDGIISELDDVLASAKLTDDQFSNIELATDAIDSAVAMIGDAVEGQ